MLLRRYHQFLGSERAILIRILIHLPDSAGLDYVRIDLASYVETNRSWFTVD